MHQFEQKFLLEHYERLGDFGDDFRNKNLYSYSLEALDPGSILEIGSGSGFFLNLLTSLGRSCAGCEIDSELVALSKKKFPQINVFNLPAGKTEGLGQFQNIVLLDVLEHIEDDEHQLKLIYKQLFSNGKLLLVVPSGKRLYGKRDKAQGHFRRYSKKELQRKLLAAGFEIEQLRFWNAVGYLPYLISERILRRPLSSSLRTGTTNKGFLKRSLIKCFDLWFSMIENRYSFGIGLSLICIARKK